MGIARAVELKREELAVRKLQIPAAELRARIGDLGPTLPVEPRLMRDSGAVLPSPQPGSRLVMPAPLGGPASGTLSPFSLEALVMQEFATQTLATPQQAPKITLIPELKRQAVPLEDPRVPERWELPSTQVHARILRKRPALLVIWTDPFYYGGRPEDLQDVHAWCRQRREEQPEPALLGADLVLEPYQLLQTRAGGGSGQLLPAGPLGHTQLEDLLGWSLELGLTPCFYVRSAAEAERVLRQGGRLLAVGPADLFSQSDMEAGRGPLSGLIRDLPQDIKALAWGGTRRLEHLDASAHAGAWGVIAGREYESLRRALRVRSEQGG